MSKSKVESEAGGTVNHITITIFEMSSRLEIKVLEGLITDVKADAYVNSTNRGLDLKLGKLSQSILKGAGNKIQTECKKKYPNGVKIGMIAVTDGYKLKCKRVFHGVLTPLDNVKEGDPIENLCNFVSGCLRLAHEENLTSIAFPPLGTGFLGYEPFVSAQAMYRCFDIFEDSYSVTTVKSVYIVIFTKGGDWMHVKQAFQRELHVSFDIDEKHELAREQSRLRREKQGVSVPKLRPALSETCIRLSQQNACKTVLPCGHVCPGYKGENTCPPCLVDGCRGNQLATQTREDDCIICYTDQLGAAPVIMLKCGHIFHLHCVKRILDNRWAGAMISFNFMKCPLCKARIDHPELTADLAPLNELYEDVSRKALMRLQFEGLKNCIDVTTPGMPFYQKPAMSRYCYYPCYQCKNAYFGGAVQCNDGFDDIDIDEKELVCAACSGIGREENCKTHGTDFIEYKCRYCCSIAVFFCFGNTHFCNTCHNQAMAMQRMKLPTCPAGPCGEQLEGKCPLGIKHAPTGEEFVLGCGLCLNMNSF